MKQENIKNRSKHEAGRKKGDKLLQAQKNKYDEFYTPMSEIKKELDHYLYYFINKNIVCPCDFDITSVTPDCVGIKIQRVDKSAYICYKIINYKHMLLEEISYQELLDLLSGRVTCNFVKYLLENSDYNSITALGYNPELNAGVSFESVDYSQYDVCITNPPFSLFKKFIQLMVTQHNQTPEFQFITISSYLYRVTPTLGIPLMLQQCYLGFGRGLHVTFINPTSEWADKRRDHTVAIDWITTYSDAQMEWNSTRLQNNITFDPGLYYFMENITMKDNTHPLKVANSYSIPDDYTGWIFSSIGTIGEISFDEFEWCGTHFRKYFNQLCPTNNPCAHNLNDDMLIHDGKMDFHGILLKRKCT